MKKFKKIKALLISAALVAAFGTMTVFGATSNTQTPVSFSGNVDFWERTFADEYRTAIKDTTGDGYAYFKWTARDSSNSFYLNMKIKNNNSGSVAASKKNNQL